MNAASKLLSGVTAVKEQLPDIGQGIEIASENLNRPILILRIRRSDMDPPRRSGGIRNNLDLDTRDLFTCIKSFRFGSISVSDALGIDNAESRVVVPPSSTWSATVSSTMHLSRMLTPFSCVAEHTFQRKDRVRRTPLLFGVFVSWFNRRGAASQLMQKQTG